MLELKQLKSVVGGGCKCRCLVGPGNGYYTIGGRTIGPQESGWFDVGTAYDHNECYHRLCGGPEPGTRLFSGQIVRLSMSECI